MPLVKDFMNEETPKRLFIYGNNRCGKTHFLSTMMEMKELNPILVDADDGRETLKKFQGFGENVKIWRIAERNKLGELPLILNLVRETGCKLLGFDTFTNFMNEAMLELSGDSGKASYPMWNLLFNKCLKFLTDLKSICDGILFTAFPRDITDSDGKIIRVEPLLVGNSFPKFLLTPFTVIGKLSLQEDIVNPVTKEVKLLQTFNTVLNGTDVIGDRTDRIGLMKNPSVRKVFTLLEKKEVN